MGFISENCNMPVRFCRQCINMLYPKENTAKRRAGEGRELVYACRNCDHKESVEVPRDPVYRNVLTHDASYVNSESLSCACMPFILH